MARPSAVFVVIALWPLHPAFAQQPRWAGGVHEIALPDKPGGQMADPYLLSPGHYVYPGEGPNYWSPHLRPFPDYSSFRNRPGVRSIQPWSRLRSSTQWRGFGYSYGACAPFQAHGSYYGGDVETAYNQGRYDADREYLWYVASQRAGRLMNQHSAMFDEGLLAFREGRYDQAAVKMLGAAEANQSNAASRLHAGHALFALGRYADGVEQIARAFELSPSLYYKGYDIRDEYGQRADFDRHLAVIRSYVATHPNDGAAITMLGYVLFYSEGPSAALAQLQRAAQLSPSSFFVPKLVTLARQASPATPASNLMPVAPAPMQQMTPVIVPREPVKRTRPAPSSDRKPGRHSDKRRVV